MSLARIAAQRGARAVAVELDSNPPPDDPGDEDQPSRDTPTRISSSYTLAA